MPELPEVETIANDLNKNVVGLKIVNFGVLNEATRRARPLLNFPENIFRKKIVGKTVLRVGRRAKMLFVDLGQEKIYVHLKMTGQLIYQLKKGGVVVGGHPILNVGVKLPNKFTRAFFEFSDGTFLYFNDIRRFGWLKLLDAGAERKELENFGAEPLSKEFTLPSFQVILSRKSKVTVKQAIMDQKYLVGVGNIYADEALFAAKIKPQRKVGSLNQFEIKSLFRAIVRILRFSIKHRGTSFSDYRDGHGRPGGFVKYLKVYGRAKQRCLVCGNLINKGVVGGRGTHWCDSCQV